MKKHFGLLSLMAAVFMLTAVCHAAGYIPKEDVALGGVTLGATEDYVSGIYGEPDDITYKTTGAFGKMKTFRYGDSFFVTFGNGKVIEISSDADNGISTPAGFTVGTPLSDVKDRYRGAGYESKDKQGKRFIRYSPEWGVYLMFREGKKGQVGSIGIYMSP